jgi:hypothetical protein
MTPDKRRNCYVQPINDQVEKIRIGLKQLDAECLSSNAKTGWIVAARKENFKEEYIAKAIGEANGTLLHKSQQVKYGSITLLPYLGTKPPMIGDASPMLTVFITSDQLAKFDELYSVTALIVVPFAVEGIEDTENKSWREKRNPQVITA